MNIVSLISKYKMVTNTPISRMEGKCYFSNNSINVLYYGTLHRLIHRKKTTASIRSRNNYQFKP